MPFLLLQNIHLLIMYTMLVLMIILLHRGRRHPQSLVLALYALVEAISNGFIYLGYAAGVQLFHNFPFSHFIYKPIFALWAPLFYFYFRYSLSADFRLSRRHLLHFAPFIVFGLLFSSLLIARGNHYLLDNLYRQYSWPYILALGVDTAVKLQYLLYNLRMVHLLHRAPSQAGRAEPAARPTSLSWLRVMVYGYAAGCLGATLSWALHLVNSPRSFEATLWSTAYFFLFFFIIFYQTIARTRIAVPHRIDARAGAGLRAMMERIDGYLVDEKRFLEPDMSLSQIARALNERERTISQAVNTIRGRNLNDYLNHLRIEHACRLLREDRAMPIFEVMYSSGFNTKGAFNLVFKKLTGVTPTQYRAQGPR